MTSWRQVVREYEKGRDDPVQTQYRRYVLLRRTLLTLGTVAVAALVGLSMWLGDSWQLDEPYLVLFGVGVAAPALIGLRVLAARTSDAVLWKRAVDKGLKELAPTPIAQLGNDKTAKIEGWVDPSSGSRKAPLSLRETVAYRATVDEWVVHVGEHGRNGWQQILDEQDGVELLVSDETGRATVESDGARIIAIEDRQWVTRGTAAFGAPGGMEFAESRGLPKGELRCREGIVERGERVVVYGKVVAVEPDPGVRPTEAVSYRGTAQRVRMGPTGQWEQGGLYVLGTGDNGGTQRQEVVPV